MLFGLDVNYFAKLYKHFESVLVSSACYCMLVVKVLSGCKREK